MTVPSAPYSISLVVTIPDDPSWDLEPGGSLEPLAALLLAASN
jgi:hypothetical protein